MVLLLKIDVALILTIKNLDIINKLLFYFNTVSQINYFCSKLKLSKTKSAILLSFCVYLEANARSLQT